MDIIDCERDSCANNGTCIELMNGFACQCLPDFDGPRCQYSRTKSDNYCKKKCLNQGKCIVINNSEKCLCSGKYFGSKCEYTRSNNTLPFVRKCSVLKFRKNHDEGACLAIGLTSLFDVHCQCEYDKENRNLVHCQIIPSPYSSKRVCLCRDEFRELFIRFLCLLLAQKCSFKKALIPATLSTLYELVNIHVCPVNWQILDQYENTQEIVNNVHTTQCQLPSNEIIQQQEK